MERHISDTAYLVNESRARARALSGDHYARHWIPPSQVKRVAQIWDAFAAEVYPHDDIELAVRNRFFLQQMKEFLILHPGAAIGNVGAGFTSYPFLLQGYGVFAELDYPDVSAEKQARVDELRQQGILPDHSLVFLSLDLNRDSDRIVLQQEWLNQFSDKLSFILMEGISYYLSHSVFLDLAKRFRAVQRSGSLFAFDFWRPDIAQHPVFQRLQRFFVERFHYAQDEYSFYDESVVESMPGYAVHVLTDVVQQERNYSPAPVLADPMQILLENYLVLERHD